jgi:hypothetical protein
MWPIQLAFCLLISCRIFLWSLTLSNTSLFLTRSVQLIFSSLLQHQISKLSRCFWSTEFQHHIKLCSKCSILLVSSSILSPTCLKVMSLKKLLTLKTLVSSILTLVGRERFFLCYFIMLWYCCFILCSISWGQAIILWIPHVLVLCRSIFVKI